ncbi:MAG: DUF167 domain-containing protein [Woeseiaceae bacterium]
MQSSWWRRDASGLHLAVRVLPRAGADGIGGVAGGRLRIRIAAAPVDDAANARLCRFIAGRFDVPRASVRLLQGNKARDKLIAVDGEQQLPGVLAGLADRSG